MAKKSTTKKTATKKTTSKSTAKRSTKTKTTKSPTKKSATKRTTKKTAASDTEAGEANDPIVEVDRRIENDRRQAAVPVAKENRKVQRRRQIDPTTCERDYSNDEIEFMHAMDVYKRNNGRMFPTCSEILEVVRSIGYQKMPLGPGLPADGSDATAAANATDFDAEPKS